MHKVTRSGLALLIFSCIQLSVFADEGFFGLNGEFVYKDLVGGPYFDEWYIAGDMDHLNNIKIFREGKSGSFETFIKVDCKLQTVAAQGASLLYGSIALSKEEAQEYFSKGITKAVVNKVCMHQPNT
ncbi:hypothetical protein LA064_004623 [Vibrio alginolyticus]|nr:hypothetical protein [Vibrio alginolyticus]